MTATASDADRFGGLPAGLRLCYRTGGPDDGTPVLLVAGLGLDLPSWPQWMVDGLVERGFRVVRLDNRDADRSSRIGNPPPGRLRQLLARPRPEAYDLADMAADTVPPDEELGRAWATAVWDRCDGSRSGAPVARQIGAIQASGERTAELPRITASTLVVHGDTDRMVHPSGGRATADAIPGARHVELPTADATATLTPSGGPR